MKCLYLLRHAKSSWKDPGAYDHERPLARRGRRAANVVVRYLRERGIEPELVLCSTARRACETLERIRPALGTPAVQIEPGLYRDPRSARDALVRQLGAERAPLLYLGELHGGAVALALALEQPPAQ